jgi:hypothetical protein
VKKSILYGTVETCVLSRSEINHLRLLLGWMRCQYMMDENMQAGYLESLEKVKAAGFEISEEGMARHQVTIDRYNNLPQYVKQGVKMLSKAIKNTAPDISEAVEAQTKIGAKK